jgi:hypothetical protein
MSTANPEGGHPRIALPPWRGNGAFDRANRSGRFRADDCDLTTAAIYCRMQQRIGGGSGDSKVGEHEPANIIDRTDVKRVEAGRYHRKLGKSSAKTCQKPAKTCQNLPGFFGPIYGTQCLSGNCRYFSMRAPF